ncbi:hypothetical protein SUDANB146_00170 [Streptomyces sp. enrichment culture]
MRRGSAPVRCVIRAMSSAAPRPRPARTPAAGTGHPTVRKVRGDGGCRKHFAEHAAILGIDLEITARAPGTGDFTSIPKRWAVERTYGRLMLHRRPARDYEALPARSEAMLHPAMTDLMARRLTVENTISWRDPAKAHQPQTPGWNNGRKRPPTARVHSHRCEHRAPQPTAAGRRSTSVPAGDRPPEPPGPSRNHPAEVLAVRRRLSRPPGSPTEPGSGFPGDRTAGFVTYEVDPMSRTET